MLSRKSLQLRIGSGHRQVAIGETWRNPDQNVSYCCGTGNNLSGIELPLGVEYSPQRSREVTLHRRFIRQQWSKRPVSIDGICLPRRALLGSDVYGISSNASISVDFLGVTGGSKHSHGVFRWLLPWQQKERQRGSVGFGNRGSRASCEA
jgi:hypothetical protein